MQVILLEKFGKLGDIGDKVKVRLDMDAII